MSVQATYTIMLDTQGDKSFGGANDDITAYVQAVNLGHGCTDAYHTMARATHCGLLLDNSTQLFSPSVGGSLGNFIGKLIKVDMIYPAVQDGTLHGNVSLGFDGPVGCSTAANFPGATGDYIDVYTASFAGRLNQATGSAMAWVKFNTWNDSLAGYVFQFYNGASEVIRIYKDAADAIIFQRIANSASKSVTLSAATHGRPTDWVLLSLTWDTGADELKAYYNGAQTGSTQTGLSASASAIATAVIGGQSTGNNLDGDAAHIAVWDTVLTGTDFTNLYNNYYLDGTYERSMAATSSANLVAWWPLDDSPAFGVPVDRSCTRTKFYGWVSGCSPVPDSTGNKRSADLEGSGILTRMLNEITAIALQENVRSDEVLEAIIESGGRWYPPGLSYWSLGDPTLSVLGVTSWLGPDIKTYHCFDQGIETYALIGDQWGDEVSVYRAIAEMASSEPGLFYEDHYGRFVFLNRHYWWEAKNRGAVATINQSDTIGADYVYGKSVYNDVSVRFAPRSIGTSTTIATLDSAFSVPAGDTRKTRLQYQVSGEKVGGKDVGIPTFTANEAADGSGVDVTSLVDMTYTILSASLEMEFTNTHTATAYITSASVSGKPVTAFNTVVVQSEDSDSINQYSRRPHTYDLHLLDDPDYADGYTQWQLLEHKDARDEITSIIIQANDSVSLLKAAHWMTIGDLVTIGTEDQTGYSGDFWILGVNHVINTECDHSVKYVLRPATTTFWTLGLTSNIGTNTVLGL